METNFLEVGKEFHCLRCHKDIPRDDFVEHTLEKCPKKDEEASLKGCKFEGEFNWFGRL